MEVNRTASVSSNRPFYKDGFSGDEILYQIDAQPLEFILLMCVIQT